jgi:hypothetical protein
MSPADRAMIVFRPFFACCSASPVRHSPSITHVDLLPGSTMPLDFFRSHTHMTTRSTKIPDPFGFQAVSTSIGDYDRETATLWSSHRGDPVPSDCPSFWRANAKQSEWNTCTLHGTTHGNTDEIVPGSKSKFRVGPHPMDLLTKSG